jgi:cytochrome c oxidase subunit 1
MGAVFAMFSAFYYWIGKMTGYNYPEALGRIHFWTFLIGVNLVFFPMHFLGLNGMPRRIPDYPQAFEGWNAVVTLGTVFTAISLVVFLLVLARTFRPATSTGAKFHALKKV